MPTAHTMTPIQQRWQPLLAFPALVVAVASQWLLDGRSYWQLGVRLYGLALLLFLLGVEDRRHLSTRDDLSASSLIARREVRWSLIGAAVLLGVITFVTAGGNRFRWYTVAAWVGSCASCVLAFAERPSGRPVAQRCWRAGGLSLSLDWRHLALLAIMLVATGFRFHRLGDIPGEMTIDHPHKLLDIRDILEGQYHIFFPRNTGRELFQFYYTATLVRGLGLPLGFETLKLGTALVSLAAVGMTYAWAAELFGARAGLFAAAFLAISRWDLGISRIGLRYPFASLPLAAAAFFLFRALRTGQRNDALWCGLILGLGLHGYSSFRVVPGLTVVIVLLKDLLDREGVQRIGRRRFWTNAALIPILAMLVFMPLGRYMVDNPGMFWYRVLTRTSDLERQLSANPISVLFSNVVNSLLAFNWRGDVGWVHLVRRAPFLDPLTGALFLLGIGMALWWSLRYRDWRTASLLLGLPLLLLPSSLSLAFPIENPSANRSSVAIPLVFTLVGLAPGLLIRATWETEHRMVRIAAILCMVLVLGTAGYLNYQSYFVDYAAQFDAQAWNASELAQVIHGFAITCGNIDQAYIAPWPSFVDGRAVAFELGHWRWYNLLDDLSVLPEHAAQPGNKLYLVHIADQGSLNRLRETYPQAQVRHYASRTPGHDFWIVFVPEAGQR
jgi:hypothetical protein